MNFSSYFLDVVIPQKIRSKGCQLTTKGNAMKYDDRDGGFTRLYEQRGRDKRVSEERTIELFERGFRAGADLWYDFETHGYDAYISDRSHKSIVDTYNGKFTRLVSDKRCLPILFAGKPHFLPRLYVAIHKGMVKFAYENGQPVYDGRPTSERIDDWIKRYKKLIVKPEALSGGRGMYFIHKNNVESRIPKIVSSYASMLSSLMVNEEYAQKISPDSLNSYRVFFFRARDGRNKLFRIIHRFGAVGSAVDNVTNGGCASEVDMNTGIMGRVFCPYEDPIRREDHPGTGEQITGIRIPNWGSKMKELEEIIDTLYWLDFGGMDVAPTPTGLKVIEINPSPGALLMQMNAPALIDEEFRAFVTSQGLFDE